MRHRSDLRCRPDLCPRSIADAFSLVYLRCCLCSNPLESNPYTITILDDISLCHSSIYILDRLHKSAQMQILSSVSFLFLLALQQLANNVPLNRFYQSPPSSPPPQELHLLQQRQQPYWRPIPFPNAKKPMVLVLTPRRSIYLKDSASRSSLHLLAL